MKNISYKNKISKFIKHDRKSHRQTEKKMSKLRNFFNELNIWISKKKKTFFFLFSFRYYYFQFILFIRTCWIKKDFFLFVFTTFSFSPPLRWKYFFQLHFQYRFIYKIHFVLYYGIKYISYTNTYKIFHSNLYFYWNIVVYWSL